MCASSPQRSFLPQILPNIVCSETEINSGYNSPMGMDNLEAITVKLREPLTLEIFLTCLLCTKENQSDTR